MFDRLMLDFKSKVPLYEQLEYFLAARIEDGTLGPGMALLASRELANLLNVSNTTVTKAYRNLQERGLAELRAGIGTCVSERPMPRNATTRLLEHIADAALLQLRRNGFDVNQFAETLTRRIAALPRAERILAVAESEAKAKELLLRFIPLPGNMAVDGEAVSLENFSLEHSPELIVTEASIIECARRAREEQQPRETKRKTTPQKTASKAAKSKT